MSNILYYGIEQKNVKMLNLHFLERRKQHNEHGSVTHLSDEKALNEALIAISFDCMLFEQKHIPDHPIAWLQKFRINRPGIKSKMILVGDEPDPLKVLTYLESGWTDYVHLPIDLPLLVEKINLYSTGTRSADRQVYSMKIDAPADVAKPGSLLEISEFDCQIKSVYPAKLDEVMIVYTPVFGENNQKYGSVMARCYKTEPHPTAPGFFINFYNFVGVTPDVLQNIRNSLRKTYVANKGSKN